MASTSEDEKQQHVSTSSAGVTSPARTPTLSRARQLLGSIRERRDFLSLAVLASRQHPASLAKLENEDDQCISVANPDSTSEAKDTESKPAPIKMTTTSMTESPLSSAVSNMMSDVPIHSTSLNIRSSSQLSFGETSESIALRLQQSLRQRKERLARILAGLDPDEEGPSLLNFSEKSNETNSTEGIAEPNEQIDKAQVLSAADLAPDSVEAPGANEPLLTTSQERNEQVPEEPAQPFRRKRVRTRSALAAALAELDEESLQNEILSINESTSDLASKRERRTVDTGLAEKMVPAEGSFEDYVCPESRETAIAQPSGESGYSEHRSCTSMRMVAELHYEQAGSTSWKSSDDEALKTFVIETSEVCSQSSSFDAIQQDTTSQESHPDHAKDYDRKDKSALRTYNEIKGSRGASFDHKERPKSAASPQPSPGKEALQTFLSHAEQVIFTDQEFNADDSSEKPKKVQLGRPSFIDCRGNNGFDLHESTRCPATAPAKTERNVSNRSRVGIPVLAAALDAHDDQSFSSASTVKSSRGDLQPPASQNDSGETNSPDHKDTLNEEWRGPEHFELHIRWSSPVLALEGMKREGFDSGSFSIEDVAFKEIPSRSEQELSQRSEDTDENSEQELSQRSEDPDEDAAHAEEGLDPELRPPTQICSADDQDDCDFMMETGIAHNDEHLPPIESAHLGFLAAMDMRASQSEQESDAAKQESRSPKPCKSCNKSLQMEPATIHDEIEEQSTQENNHKITERTCFQGIASLTEGLVRAGEANSKEKKLNFTESKCHQDLADPVEDLFCAKETNSNNTLKATNRTADLAAPSTASSPNASNRTTSCSAKGLDDKKEVVYDPEKSTTLHSRNSSLAAALEELDSESLQGELFHGVDLHCNESDQHKNQSTTSFGKTHGAESANLEEELDASPPEHTGREFCDPICSVIFNQMKSQKPADPTICVAESVMKGDKCVSDDNQASVSLALSSFNPNQTSTVKEALNEQTDLQNEMQKGSATCHAAEINRTTLSPSTKQSEKFTSINRFASAVMNRRDKKSGDEKWLSMKAPEDASLKPLVSATSDIQAKTNSAVQFKHHYHRFGCREHLVASLVECFETGYTFDHVSSSVFLKHADHQPAFEQVCESLKVQACSYVDADDMTTPVKSSCYSGSRLEPARKLKIALPKLVDSAIVFDHSDKTASTTDSTVVIDTVGSKSSFGSYDNEDMTTARPGHSYHSTTLEQIQEVSLPYDSVEDIRQDISSHKTATSDYEPVNTQENDAMMTRPYVDCSSSLVSLESPTSDGPNDSLPSPEYSGLTYSPCSYTSLVSNNKIFPWLETEKPQENLSDDCPSTNIGSAPDVYQSRMNQSIQSAYGHSCDDIPPRVTYLQNRNTLKLPENFLLNDGRLSRSASPLSKDSSLSIAERSKSFLPIVCPSTKCSNGPRMRHIKNDVSQTILEISPVEAKREVCHQTTDGDSGMFVQLSNLSLVQNPTQVRGRISASAHTSFVDGETALYISDVSSYEDLGDESHTSGWSSNVDETENGSETSSIQHSQMQSKSTDIPPLLSANIDEEHDSCDDQLLQYSLPPLPSRKTLHSQKAPLINEKLELSQAESRDDEDGQALDVSNEESLQTFWPSKKLIVSEQYADSICRSSGGLFNIAVASGMSLVKPGKVHVKKSEPTQPTGFHLSSDFRCGTKGSLYEIALQSGYDLKSPWCWDKDDNDDEENFIAARGGMLYIAMASGLTKEMMKSRAPIVINTRPYSQYSNDAVLLPEMLFDDDQGTIINNRFVAFETSVGYYSCAGSHYYLAQLSGMR